MHAALFWIGIVLMVVGTILVFRLILMLDREDFVSEQWIQEQAKAPVVEVQTFGYVEHSLRINGRELLRHRDEGVVEGVRRALPWGRS